MFTFLKSRKSRKPTSPRTAKRRTLRFESLEGKQMLSGGPLGGIQPMITLKAACACTINSIQEQVNCLITGTPPSVCGISDVYANGQNKGMPVPGFTVTPIWPNPQTGYPGMVLYTQYNPSYQTYSILVSGTPTSATPNIGTFTFTVSATGFTPFNVTISPTIFVWDNTGTVGPFTGATSIQGAVTLTYKGSIASGATVTTAAPMAETHGNTTVSSNSTKFNIGVNTGNAITFTNNGELDVFNGGIVYVNGSTNTNNTYAQTSGAMLNVNYTGTFDTYPGSVCTGSYDTVINAGTLSYGSTVTDFYTQITNQGTMTLGGLSHVDSLTGDNNGTYSFLNGPAGTLYLSVGVLMLDEAFTNDYITTMNSTGTNSINVKNDFTNASGATLTVNAGQLLFYQNLFPENDGTIAINSSGKIEGGYATVLTNSSTGSISANGNLFEVYQLINSGAITGSVTDDYEVFFDNTSNYTFTGVISGAGIVYIEPGDSDTVITFTQSQQNSGATNVMWGALKLSNNGTTNAVIAGGLYVGTSNPNYNAYLVYDWLGGTQISDINIIGDGSNTWISNDVTATVITLTSETGCHLVAPGVVHL